MVREATVIKLISVFLPELAGGFTIRELAKKAGISYDAAYRHAKSLVRDNILKEKRVGKALVCSLNLKNALARKYLEKISVARKEDFLKKDVVLRSLFNELVENLRKAAQNELVCVVLFGSYARGTQAKDSDIDVLVISSTFGIREKLEQECGGVEHRYGIDVAPLITTSSEFVKMLKSRERMVAHEVQADGIVLYGFENYYLLLSEGVSND